MKQQGRRGSIFVLAGSAAVIIAVLMVFRPWAGESPDAAPFASAGNLTAATAPTGQAASASQVSMQQLPTPYDYRDAGDEMFVLGAPTPTAKPGEQYPVQVQLNRAGAERAASTPGGSLDVTLPDGTRYPVTFERAETGRGGNWTWIGRVESPLGNLAAVLTYGRDGVFGVLPAPDGRLFQVKTNHGQAFLQPDPGLVPPGSDPATLPPDYVLPPQNAPAPMGNLSPRRANAIVMPGQVAGTSPAVASTPVSMAALEDGAPVQITVLGVYTSNLVQERGSESAAESEFINALVTANQALLDSGTVVRFKLAGLIETDYPGATFNEAALNDLRANTLPDGIDIHAERDALGADLVTMLRPGADGDTNCGIAYLSGAGLGGTNAWAELGYGVVSCGAYTMAHELGHNLGSAHDRETATENGKLGYGAFEFSFGYRQSTPTKFATIMAYSLAGQPWIGYFSAPDTTLCMGGACGIDGKSDNVRSINLMAETISRFRDPANTISVMDAKVVEPYDGIVTLDFQVRLSTPAPAGGVTFDIAIVPGGTATTGVDFTQGSLSGQVIPAGERESRFSVDVLPDVLVEGDETVMVRLSNVVGMTLFDSEATGLILDDDPRATVSGALVFPDGVQGPASVSIDAQLNFDGVIENQNQVVFAPDYEYAFEATRGAYMHLSAAFAEQDPWISTTVDIGKVQSDMVRNYTVVRGVRLTGRVKWPEGGSAPTSTMIVWAWNAHRDGWAPGRYAYPPTYDYSFKIRPGVAVGLATQDAPAPYVDQRVELSAFEDVVQDVTLSTLPSLTVAHQLVEEGAGGTEQSLDITARLSVAAPPGGVSFDLVIEEGSATEGADYFASITTLTIPEGSKIMSVPGLVSVAGDDVLEGDEEFRIVAKNIQGAHMPSPGVIHILDDERRLVSNDFDGDGQSELVWRHGTTGRAALWGGAQYARVWNLTSVRDLGWRIVGTGDFNRDHKADLLWRHSGHGRNTIWRTGDSGTQLGVTTVPDVNWAVAGVGDFDGDLQSDVLWHHRGTGANMIWRGGDSWATTPVTRITDTDWGIAGVGDFDGDGHADILWRHGGVGANVIWLSGDYHTQQRMVSVTDQNWTVAGVGDFNGDSKDDVLWTHLSSGNSVIWHSADRSDQRSLTRVTDLAWDIVTVGDYDGDGIADVVWRNGTTGRNAVWLGGDYGNQLPVVGVRDTNWRIVH